MRKLKKQEKLDIERMKKAKKLINQVNKLLNKCEFSIALYMDIIHAADQIDEDIKRIKIGEEAFQRELL